MNYDTTCIYIYIYTYTYLSTFLSTHDHSQRFRPRSWRGLKDMADTSNMDKNHLTTTTTGHLYPRSFPNKIHSEKNLDVILFFDQMLWINFPSKKICQNEQPSKGKKKLSVPKISQNQSKWTIIPISAKNLSDENLRDGFFFRFSPSHLGSLSFRTRAWSCRGGPWLIAEVFVRSLVESPQKKHVFLGEIWWIGSLYRWFVDGFSLFQGWINFRFPS